MAQLQIETVQLGRLELRWDRAHSCLVGLRDRTTGRWLVRPEEVAGAGRQPQPTIGAAAAPPNGMMALLELTVRDVQGVLHRLIPPADMASTESDASAGLKVPTHSLVGPKMTATAQSLAQDQEQDQVRAEVQAGNRPATAAAWKVGWSELIELGSGRIWPIAVEVRVRANAIEGSGCAAAGAPGCAIDARGYAIDGLGDVADAPGRAVEGPGYAAATPDPASGAPGRATDDPSCAAVSPGHTASRTAVGVPDEATVWTITVHNRSAYPVVEVLFPCIRGAAWSWPDADAGAGAGAGADAGEYLIYPHHAGEKIDRPRQTLGTERYRSFGRAATEVDALGRMAREINYCGLASMMWMDYVGCWRSTGDDSERPANDELGCYLASYDPEFLLTGVRAEVDPAGRLGLGFRKHVPIYPGDAWESPPVVLAFHDGDWHRPARWYSQWFRTTPGWGVGSGSCENAESCENGGSSKNAACGGMDRGIAGVVGSGCAGGLSGRRGVGAGGGSSSGVAVGSGVVVGGSGAAAGSVSDLATESVVTPWYDLRRAEGVLHRFAELPAIYDGLVERWGTRHLFLAGWNRGGFDSQYPEYLPDLALGDPWTLAQATAHVRRCGGFVTFYVNSRLFDRRSFYYACLGEPWLIRATDGTPHLERYGPAEFGVCCPAHRLWQEHLRHTAQWLVQAYGARGIYYDQLGSAEPFPCYAPTHTHLDSAGRLHHGLYNRGYVELLETTAHELAQLRPDPLLMIENCGDLYSSRVWASLVWNGTLYDEYFRLFKYTFPELNLVQMVQPRASIHDLSEKLSCFLRDLAEAWLLGSIFWIHAPRLERPADVPPSVTAQMVRWAQGALALRRAVAPYLARTRFVDTDALARWAQPAAEQDQSQMQRTIELERWPSRSQAGSKPALTLGVTPGPPALSAPPVLSALSTFGQPRWATHWVGREGERPVHLVLRVTGKDHCADKDRCADKDHCGGEGHCSDEEAASQVGSVEAERIGLWVGKGAGQRRTWCFRRWSWQPTWSPSSSPPAQRAAESAQAAELRIDSGHLVATNDGWLVLPGGETGEWQAWWIEAGEAGEGGTGHGG